MSATTPPATQPTAPASQPTAAPEPAKKPRPEGQSTSQVYDFAAEIGRDIAKRLTESPKTIVSAALIGFSQLEPATQVALINDAKIRRLAGMQSK